MSLELWKDIPGFEGYYQVSNFGRVLSLERTYFLKRNNCQAIKKEKIIPGSKMREGYLGVKLTLGSIKKFFKMHQLVAMAFLGHFPDRSQKIVVDHIDNNKLNNNLNNLQLITQRLNASKDRINTSSEYTGVCWDKVNNKWRAIITINGKNKCLGRYVSELSASEAYQKKLKELQC